MEVAPTENVRGRFEIFKNYEVCLSSPSLFQMRLSHLKISKSMGTLHYINKMVIVKTCRVLNIEKLVVSHIQPDCKHGEKHRAKKKNKRKNKKNERTRI